MADGPYEERFAYYDDMHRRLTAMLVEQYAHNQRMDATIEALREFNRQQVQINVRLETLLARVLRQDALPAPLALPLRREEA